MIDGTRMSSESPAASVDVVLLLRSRQVQYLEYLAERDDTPLSHALTRIITRAEDQIAVDPPIQPQKLRKHVSLPQRCLAFIELLASRWGIPKSDVVRRLIDDAAARDPTV